MKKLLACAVGVMVAAGMMADVPFNASLTPDISIVGPAETVNGLTLSIWGENPQHSLALGFVNGTAASSSGLSLGLLNYGDDYVGVQWGIVNFEKGSFLGWQNAFVNYAGGEVTGLQSGFVNCAGNLTGLQFGFVNYARQANQGVQIGVLNVIPQNDYWFTMLPNELAPAMIIVNWRF